MRNNKTLSDYYRIYTEGNKKIELSCLKNKINLICDIIEDIQKQDGWQDDFELEHFYTEMCDGYGLLADNIKELEKAI